MAVDFLEMDRRGNQGQRTSANTSFHAAAARARGLAAACNSMQIRIVWAADMPAPCFARLRHVVNNRDVSDHTLLIATT
jgi:hypothetical protein